MQRCAGGATSALPMLRSELQLVTMLHNPALSRTATRCRCRCKRGKQTRASRRKVEEWGRHQCRSEVFLTAAWRQPPICSHSRQLPLTSASHPGRSGRAQSGQLHRWPAPPGRRMPVATGQGCGQPCCSQGGHSSLALVHKDAICSGCSARLAPTLDVLPSNPQLSLPMCHVHAQELLNVAQHARGGVKCRTPPACHASTWNHWGSGCCQQRAPLLACPSQLCLDSPAAASRRSLQATILCQHMSVRHECSTHPHTEI